MGFVVGVLINSREEEGDVSRRHFFFVLVDVVGECCYPGEGVNDGWVVVRPEVVGEVVLREDGRDASGGCDEGTGPGTLRTVGFRYYRAPA